MAGLGIRLRLYLLLGSRGGAVFATGVWPQGLLDAYIAMFLKVDGDSTPLGQLPVIYRLWPSLRLTHLNDSVPVSVFSLGNDISSVEAWFSTVLEIEEVFSGACDEQLHVLVADVVLSFDTVDRSILDSALGRLGLPLWFRKVYLAYHPQMRLRFTLAAGLGEPWCRDGSTPQRCPLSMIFIVALLSVGVWTVCHRLLLSCTRTILSAILCLLVLDSVLSGSRCSTSGLSTR